LLEVDRRYHIAFASTPYLGGAGLFEYDTDLVGFALAAASLLADADLPTSKRGRALVRRQLFSGMVAKPGSVRRSTPEQVHVKATSTGKGQCVGKRYCNEMASCEDAKRYLRQCRLSKLDRDGDGVPCESLCR
jgi:hypothetical protein